MHAHCPPTLFSPRPTGPFRGFLLISILLHALILVFWSAGPPAGIPGGGVLQVRLAPGVSLSGDADSHRQTSAPATAAQSAGRASASSAAASTATATGTSTAIKHENPPVDARKTETTLSDTSPPMHNGQAQTVQTAAINSNPDANESSTPAPASTNSPPAALAGGSAASSPLAGEQGGTGGDTGQRIEAALRRALLPHFDYPLLARRRGWEGRVRIALLVQPDGDLTNMHILESSGYRILDNAALEDLREVGRLPQASTWLSGRQMDVILPIQYRFR